jgi:F-type H+-transporting ATPase subunit gamma
MERCARRLDHTPPPERNTVTRRRTLERHRHSLAEIQGIMNSMKSLAYLETRKLTRFLDAQHAVVKTIEEAAADLLSFHPEILPEAKEVTPVYLLIGAERGFCGDFNRALLRQLESTQLAGGPVLIAIGRKLHTLCDGDARVVAWIEGACLAEEITSVLNQLVDEIISLQSKHGTIEVFCVYHGTEDSVEMQRLLPPFEGLAGKPPHYPCPPVLNLPPAEFFIELTDQYLFANLHTMLYTSLMIENHQRITHLEGAVRHLADKSEDLARQCNALRQEEIIEEIEVILLNSTQPALLNNHEIYTTAEIKK